MKSSISCCISCILAPCCEALDVIRIVHSDGRIEEIRRTVLAADVMKAHPKHILKKPTSRSPLPSDIVSGAASPVVPRIVIVPPDAELKRGKIYFLMPDNSSSGGRVMKTKKKVKEKEKEKEKVEDGSVGCMNSEKVITTGESDGHRRPQRMMAPTRGRAVGWRPCLESIGETADSVTSTSTSIISTTTGS